VLTLIVADPEPATLAGAIVAVSPINGVSIRLTVPLNRFSAVIVTVELPVAPARIVIVLGLAVTAKSTTWTVRIIECVRVPFEPLIVTV
jgi:hypothetical protein